MIQIPEELTPWTESCLHMNHLGSLTQRELPPGKQHVRAIDLAERVKRMAWKPLSRTGRTWRKKTRRLRGTGHLVEKADRPTPQNTA